MVQEPPRAAKRPADSKALAPCQPLVLPFILRCFAAKLRRNFVLGVESLGLSHPARSCAMRNRVYHVFPEGYPRPSDEDLQKWAERSQLRRKGSVRQSTRRTPYSGGDFPIEGRTEAHRSARPTSRKHILSTNRGFRGRKASSYFGV